MIHSFLMIGQSNMAGRGDLKEAPPLNSDRIAVLRNGRWQPLFRPINPDRPFSGFCLAESFAQDYAAAHPGVTVGLIPCADGGTSLNQWRVGGLLFDHAVMQAVLASRTSTIAGILWHQGEADCSPALFPLYEEKLTCIIAGLRAIPELADVPFIAGGLGDYLPGFAGDPHASNYPHINETLRQMTAKVERFGFADAEGLAHKGDYLHFSTPSLIELGHRYYRVFSRLEDKNKVFSDKPDMDAAFRTDMEKL